MNRILIGDCRDTMRELIAQGVKVQTCVTSPPYWGLRDYGVPPSLWGGEASCEHEFGLIGKMHRGGANGGGAATIGRDQSARDAVKEYPTGQTCTRCGCWRGCLGLEPTPQMYVQHLVEVAGLVRDLLADDGTLWLNLGDSYAGSGRGGHVSDTSTLDGSIEHEQQSRVARGSQLPPGLHSAAAAAGNIGRAWVPPPSGLKQKDLVGIPWRVAFALQADGCADWRAVQLIERVRAEILDPYQEAGESVPDRVLAVLERLDAEYREAKGNSWYLRQDIIWAKPNPMPESVRDRCTKSHEYLFLLAKRERYFYDAEAIAEASVYADEAIYDNGLNGHAGGLSHAGQGSSIRKFRKTPSYWDTDPGHHNAFHRKGRSGNKERKPASARGVPVDTDGKTSGAVAGSVPWEGVTRNKRSVWTVTTQPYSEAHFATFPPELIKPCILAGSRPGDVVFDPFMGSGTTAQVALELGRQYLGCELNSAYLPLIERRARQFGLELAP